MFAPSKHEPRSVRAVPVRLDGLSRRSGVAISDGGPGEAPATWRQATQGRFGLLGKTSIRNFVAVLAVEFPELLPVIATTKPSAHHFNRLRPLEIRAPNARRG